MRNACVWIALALSLGDASAANCNTRSGQVDDQPALPTFLTPGELSSLPVEAAPDVGSDPRAQQTILLE